ncbi:Pleckstrin homology domain-containing protein, partial [Lactarius hengduanensis]
HLVTKSVNTSRGFFSFTHAQQSPSETDEPVEELIDQYAYAFYLKLGGSEEGWNEEQENYVKDEMMRRWRDSAWGRLWRRRKEISDTTHARWVLPNDAGSFQVGEFLGLNTYAEQTISRHTANPWFIHSDWSIHLPRLLGWPFDGDQRFLCDGSFSRQPRARNVAPSTVVSPPGSADRLSERHRTRTGPTDAVPRLKPALRARALTQAKSDGAIDGTTGATLGLSLNSVSGKGKAKKAVRLPSDPHPFGTPTLPASVSPGKVLERTGSELHGKSATAEEELRATEIASADIPDEYDDARMKDRMVVRVAYCKDGSLAPRFDEMQNRSARNLQYEDWTEFMVVWRNDRLELYDDYRLPCREWLAGHKHLAFVVPLKNVRTKLSLYSFTDMSFCITCPPASLSSGVKTLLPFQRRTGTNVFVFKARCRSRAIDWIWRLWRDLGGILPPFIEVRSPVLDTRMKIDVPESANHSIFSHDNLVALCVKTLSTVQDWDVIIRKRLAEGAHMELAWRLDTNLDWVWWLDDIHGNPRAWAVLAGLALNQAGRAAHLEVRLAEHMASQLHIKDGHQLSEPPSVEGYVSRVKPGSGTREEVYLTVHNGLLFTLAPASAHAPNPPGVVPVPQDSDRNARDALAARGVMDLRTVIAVRRAFRPVLHPNEHVHASTQPEIEENGHFEEQVVREENDTRDVGGDTGLTGDVTTIRTRRCFELLMKSGHVIRFETWSAKVAIEWIERLRALIRYWTLRHFVDTRQEMDVVHYATGRPRITPQRLRHEECDNDHPPEPQANPAIVLPYLSSIYHRCVYEGCRPIVKAGRVFVRQGLHGRYKLVQMFLVASQLVQFQIKPKSTNFRRRGKPVSLLDAYVVSGVFAAQALPKGQYNPNNPATPRRYADGLESDDSEENTLFTVYYVPRKMAQAEKVPSLNVAKKVMVFRCRSRVERDVWCWAMNTQIEKLARERRDREKLRNTGAPIPLEQVTRPAEIVL